jgi:hypothetical protein
MQDGGSMYVQAFVDNLIERFHDLHIFNISNFLIQSIIQIMDEEWSERLIIKVESDASRTKLFEFVET